MSEEILYSKNHGIATLTLNRPQVRNAFGDHTRSNLLEKLINAEQDPEVRCVIITGAGKAFAAGGDINSMMSQQANDDAQTISDRMATAGEVVSLIRRMQKPVIAAVNGAAAGGGLNLALACDLRYAADTAVFVQSFVKIGLMPDWGGHYFLTQLVGTAKALELFLYGDKVLAADALKLGLINAVYSSDELMEAVMSKAQQLAKAPREAVAAIKQATYFANQNTLEDTLRLERANQARLLLTDNAREGMRAFVEKRAPIFNCD